MSRLMFNTASHFLMASHGMGGSGGPIKPVITSVDAFARINNGLNDLDRLVQGTAAAKDNMAKGVRGLRDHVKAMEDEIFRSRERIAELEGLEEELARVHEETATTEKVTAKQRREWNEITSLLEQQLAKSAEAAKIAGRIFDRANATRGDLTAVTSAIASLIESLGPIMGEESPVIKTLGENADVIGGILAQTKKIEKARDDLMPLLEGEVISGNTASSVYRHLGLPPLDEESYRLIPMLSSDKEILKRIFRRLQTMFNDMAPEKNVARLDAFMKAFGTLWENQKIEGTRKFIDYTIKTFVDRSKKDWETRGFYYQFIRLAHMIESGRTIDSISHTVQGVSFLGWILHRGKHILSHVAVSEAEIDAIAEGTLIEFKTVWMGDLLGKYLTKILKTEGDLSSMIPVETDSIEEIGSHVEHAVKIANQLLKYKTLIERGEANELELHVTSFDPVPDEVVTAIHDLFGAESVKIFWYHDMLDKRGRILRLPRVIVEAREKDIIKEQRFNALAAAYQSGIARMVGHDTSRVENFVDWLVSKGSWTKIVSASSGNKRTIKDELRTRVQEWIKIESKPSSASAANPWAGVDDKKAGKRFNTLLNSLRVKGTSLDWSKDRTQGIQNVDIVEVLSWMQKQDEVKTDAQTNLSEEISAFIAYIRERYQSGMASYFQTGRDGPRLLGIMKRYCWVTDRG